jgi:sec-independent protein translocase protein TatB
MDFLGIGLPELIIILIVAVIVVGPKRMPQVAVQIARVIRQLRGYATDVTAQMRSELDELTREYEQVRKELHEFRQAATKDLDSVSREVDRTVRDVPAVIESSAEPEPKRRAPPPRNETTEDDGS